MALIIEIKRFIDHFCLQVDPLDLPCSETVDVTNSTLVAYLKNILGTKSRFMHRATPIIGFRQSS